MQRISRYWRLATVGAVALTLALPSAAAAVPKGVVVGKRLAEPEEDSVKARRKRSAGFTVSRWGYARLKEAQESVAEEKYDAAISVIEEMKGRDSLNDHERALMWQTAAFAWAGKENFAKAADAFEQCLLLHALPEGGMHGALFNLGQMYMAGDNFKEAIPALEEWFSVTKKPGAQAYYLLAVAYSQMKKFRPALTAVKKAIALKKKPSEAWLQMQLSLHFELKEYREIVAVLYKLIPRFPRKSYWMQLSAVYAELNDEARALAALELAHRQGLLTTDTELLNLARWYMDQEVPFKAAVVLEGGLKKGVLKRDLETTRLLANAHLRSRDFERALAPLSEAAALHDDGSLYLQLAQLHLEAQRWKAAVVALEAAEKKGELHDPGNAHLLRGIAYYSMGQRGKARAAFEKASRSPKSKRAAREWLKLLRNQDQQRQAMQQ